MTSGDMVAKPYNTASAQHSSPGSAPDPEVLDIIPLRHRGRWVSGAVAIVCAGLLIWSALKNPNIQWPVVRHYLLASVTLRGVETTLELTGAAIAIGFVGGIGLAMMSLSENPVLRAVARLYLIVMRGTPVLVQIIFWGYLGAFYHRLIIGIPFTHVTFVNVDTNRIVGATLAALLALALNEIAYASEIIRAGLISVDHGQREAAASLGMTPAWTMYRIVIPQAMRTIIPPFGNALINMLKTTSLVSVIGGHDLMTNMQNIYSQTFQVIPLLTVAAIWYCALTTLLGIPQRMLEKRYGRGSAVATRGLRLGSV